MRKETALTCYNGLAPYQACRTATALTAAAKKTTLALAPPIALATWYAVRARGEPERGQHVRACHTGSR
jgi:hypothetical protein